MGPRQPFCQPYDFKSARIKRVARRRRRHFDCLAACVCPPRVICRCASKETAVNSCSVSDLASYQLQICDFQQKMEDFDDDLDYELSQLDLTEYNLQNNIKNVTHYQIVMLHKYLTLISMIQYQSHGPKIIIDARFYQTVKMIRFPCYQPHEILKYGSIRWVSNQVLFHILNVLGLSHFHCDPA